MSNRNIGPCVNCSEKNKKNPNCKKIKSCPFYKKKRSEIDRILITKNN